MAFTIRRALLKDAEQLAAISIETFADTFSGTCTEDDMQQFLTENFNLEKVKAELANENDFYFFIEENGVAAGYARFMEDYSFFPEIKKWKALELKRIYITKEFHGKGIAQQLLKFVEDFARENKYEVLWLGVWEHNYKAKRFYEKCGFRDSGYMHDFPIGSTPQSDNWLWKFLNQ